MSCFYAKRKKTESRHKCDQAVNWFSEASVVHVQRKITGCASDYVFHSQEALTNKPKKRKQKKEQKKNKKISTWERDRREERRNYIYLRSHCYKEEKEKYILWTKYIHTKRHIHRINTTFFIKKAFYNLYIMNYRYYTYESRCTELWRFDLTMCISTYLRDNIILFIMWVRGYMTKIPFSIFHLNYRLIKWSRSLNDRGRKLRRTLATVDLVTHGCSIGRN